MLCWYWWAYSPRSSSLPGRGNIGIPIALYAVGSSAPVVSVLLAQLLVIAPVFLTIFAWYGRKITTTTTAVSSAGAPPTLGRTVLRSVANPVTGLRVTLVRDIILMSSLMALPASLLVALLLG